MLQLEEVDVGVGCGFKHRAGFDDERNVREVLHQETGRTALLRSRAVVDAPLNEESTSTGRTDRVARGLELVTVDVTRPVGDVVGITSCRSIRLRVRRDG